MRHSHIRRPLTTVILVKIDSFCNLITKRAISAFSSPNRGFLRWHMKSQPSSRLSLTINYVPSVQKGSFPSEAMLLVYSRAQRQFVRLFYSNYKRRVTIGSFHPKNCWTKFSKWLYPGYSQASPRHHFGLYADGGDLVIAPADGEDCPPHGCSPRTVLPGDPPNRDHQK
jgi:hypothetical protein